MNTDEIIRLLLRKTSGAATPEELSLLQTWAEDDKARQDLLKEFEDHDTLADYRRLREQIPTNRPCREMKERLDLNHRHLHKKYAAWAAAAAAVVLLAVAAARYIHTPDDIAPKEKTALVNIEQLHPGLTKAVLTRADGSKVELDPSTATVALQHDESDGDDTNLSLEVPRGGEFMIVLEDSTKVWLNSSSRLIYPEHFAEGNRHVSIEGEAYFEVAKDSSRPFYVEIPGAQFVKVYGTEFNIRSYPEDADVKTTLTKGSISITPVNGNGGELFLSPGNQAIIDKTTSTANIRSVDVERVSGWRNGRFVFEEQTLYQIMQDLGRWYDFEFEFADDDLRETIFMGSIPRYSNFTTAISILEKSGGIRFDIADNKVKISKRKDKK